MTLYELYHKAAEIGIHLTTTHIPLMKDGKNYDLDMALVTDDDGSVKHIEVNEK